MKSYGLFSFMLFPFLVFHFIHIPTSLHGRHSKGMRKEELSMQDCKQLSTSCFFPSLPFESLPCMVQSYKLKLNVTYSSPAFKSFQKPNLIIFFCWVLIHVPLGVHSLLVLLVLVLRVACFSLMWLSSVAP